MKCSLADVEKREATYRYNAKHYAIQHLIRVSDRSIIQPNGGKTEARRLSNQQS
jgi:hypothetical protein